MSAGLATYVEKIRACRLCAEDMLNTPNPILQVHESARILVVGQAPGNLADTTGKPFNDPSGVRLRDWMGVTDEEFYDARRVAIVPMGFCFPGYDRNGGDIPPMKRCAKEWREGLLARLPEIRVTLLVGSYAQRWHLGPRYRKSLRETVLHWKDYISDHMFTTPHPSWRNNAWLKANPWFESEVLPALRASVRSCL